MTPRQNQILSFIKAVQAATGVTPSFHEMRLHLGLRSKSSIHRLIESLEDVGLIERARTAHNTTKARSITVIDSDGYERGRAVGRREGYADAMRETGRAV